MKRRDESTLFISASTYHHTVSGPSLWLATSQSACVTTVWLNQWPGFCKVRASWMTAKLITKVRPLDLDWNVTARDAVDD